MWVKEHKQQLAVGLLALLCGAVVMTPRALESVLILLFAGGLPGSDHYLSPIVMMIFWGVAALLFVLWAIVKLSPRERAVPTAGQAFYHRTASVKPFIGRRATSARAVRRRYKKLDA